MLSAATLETMRDIFSPECIQLNAPLKDMTSFRVGGPAACLIEVESEEQLSKAFRVLHLVDCPFYVMGNGSNTLVRDAGFDGVVLHIGKQMQEMSVNGTQITVQAGAMLSSVAQFAAKEGLTGLEFAAGIPGSIGGAIAMNAGAYDGEMKQVVHGVHVINSEGELFELSNADMEFDYRTSIVRKRPMIVTEVTFELKEGCPEEIFEKMKTFNERRREKQPLEFPSAGSTFKRPEGHYAGQLIMEAGMRGFQIGGARVSDKHCGFVVNTGNATAADVLDVIDEVRERVKMRFAIELEPEVVILD